jgi:hypothetical protein
MIFGTMEKTVRCYSGKIIPEARYQPSAAPEKQRRHKKYDEI